MARPSTLDLTGADLPWRRVPMDGANGGIDVVPLASHPDDLVMLVRFPPGFVRDVPGGYHAAETFLVLEGELELEGRVLRRGDLTHVPAEYTRQDMRTPDGCTAVAWFSGPAAFVEPPELGECLLQVRTVNVIGTGPGALLATPEAEWSIDDETRGEGVDLAMTTWALAGPGCPGPVLVRSRR